MDSSFPPYLFPFPPYLLSYRAVRALRPASFRAKTTTRPLIANHSLLSLARPPPVQPHWSLVHRSIIESIVHRDHECWSPIRFIVSTRPTQSNKQLLQRRRGALVASKKSTMAKSLHRTLEAKLASMKGEHQLSLSVCSVKFIHCALIIVHRC